MKTRLTASFALNGLWYQQVRRTEHAAMYRVVHPDLKTTVAYEVWEIPVVLNKHTGMQEEKPVKNEEFGVKFYSRCFTNQDLAEKAFEKLLKRLRAKYKQAEKVWKTAVSPI